MSYSVQIKRSAAKELARIAKSDRSRLVQAIDSLAENPFKGSVLKGELQGLRRIRVGDYRIVYEDQEASQITAAVAAGGDIYLGTANPAKLIKLDKTFAVEGTYTSDLIDASQPAKWGKLQIEADIPDDCRVRMASRSGNVKDVNDPTFTDWTELRDITGPVQLRCPAGRFCQYKLLLLSENGGQTPVIREVAVADTIPNLAPKVEAVSVERISSAGKEGTFKIAYKATDGNNDKLIYTIDLKTDVIDEITFATSQGDQGNLKFSYLQSVDGVSEEFIRPTRPWSDRRLRVIT